MKTLGIAGIIFFVLFSCGKSDSPAEFHEVGQDKLLTVVNDYGLEAGGNISIDKVIFNDEKGIYFTLFNDNRMNYELIGLGSGEGEWNIAGNSLFLYADTGLFDLNVEIKEKGSDGLYFFYRDRFGAQVVKVYVKNE